MTSSPRPGPGSTVRVGTRRAAAACCVAASALGLCAAAPVAAQIVPGESAFLRPATAPVPYGPPNPLVRSLDPDIRRGVTITSRPRPEYDPPGIRYGGMVVRPTLQVDGMYDDNILASAVQKEFDWIALTTAGAEVASDWSRHEIRLSGQVDDRRYARFDSQDSTAWRLNAQGRYDISRFQAVDARLSAARIYIPRDDSEDIASVQPVAVDERLASLGYAVRENRLGVRLAGLYQSLRFLPAEVVSSTGAVVPASQAYRNRDMWLGSVGLSYVIAPLRSAVLIARLNQRDYVDQAANAGTPGGPYNRSSSGYEVLAGLDSDYNGIFSFRLLVGWMEQFYQDDRLPSPSVPTFDVALVWNPTTLTTVRALANRMVTESIRTDTSSIVRTNIGASVDHELLRNVLLNGALGYKIEAYQGSGQTNRTIVGQVGATWMLNRNLRLGASYTYQNGDGNQTNSEYDRNVFLLRLSAAL